MIQTAAHKLHDYAAFRAEREGKAYALTPAFFHTALAEGCRRFFGVRVAEDGTLVEDNEQPVLFQEWKADRVH